MIDRFLTRSLFRFVWLLFIIVACGGALGSAQVRYIEKEDVSFIDTPTKDFDSANAECRTRVVADYVPAEHLVLGGVRYSLEYTQLLTIVTSHINLNKALYASTASGGSTTVSFLMSGTDSLLANTWRWVGGRYNATVFYTTQNLCVLGFYCNWQAGQPPPFTWQHCMAMEGPRPPDVNTDIVWTASSARWHVVPCNDTRIPAMCRAYRCVLTLDCMPVNTASVSGYFPTCKCKCRPGFKGKDCRFAVTATLPLTLTQEQSANTRSRSMTMTVTTTQSVSTSLSAITHASTNTKSAAQTNTAPLTSTAERTKTKLVPPTQTTTVTRTMVQTTSLELSQSLTGLATVTAPRTLSRTATRTLVFVTPSMSATRTHVLTKTGLVTDTQTKKLTLTKIKTESTSVTRSLVPIRTRTSTESRSQIATRTLERPATETMTTTVSSYESVSITKLATLTSPGKRTLSRSVTAVGPATSTISATLLITKTLSVPLTDTRTRIPPPTATKSRTLQKTVSSTLTRSKDLPLTPSAYTLSEVITITKTKVFTETATRSTSRTLTRTKLPPNTPTIPDPVTVTQSKTLVITASLDPERTETPQFLTIDRTLTRTLALSQSKGSHSLTVTRSISGTTSSSKSWSTTITVTHSTTPSHTMPPPPTQTLDVPTRTMTSTFEETISSSLTLTQTIEPPPTPEPTPSLTKLATSSATYSMNSGSSTASLMGTMTSELTQSLTITTSLEIPSTLSTSLTVSKTQSDPIAEIVLEYLGAPQQELAFALASAWVPGLVQCRATSNVSAIPLLLGIDARQIAAQQAHLISDKGVWRQCFERQCFPRGVGGAVVCSDVEVPCNGHADEAVVDALSLARVLARHREEATKSLRMVLFRSLSPFTMGTSPLWVLLGSLAATGGAAIVQAGLGTLLFRFIYGRYYSWRSCLAGVHGASIAISWTYTLAGGVGVTLLHIFLNNIGVPAAEDMRFGSGRGVASRTGAWSPTLWQWGGPSYSDSAIKAQCDPLFVLCSSLTMRVGIDPRLVDACLPCYDYYTEGRDAEATSDGGFIDDPAVNTFLVESEAFATFALIMSVLIFVIAFPVLSYLAVSWYATPRRYFGLPYEADGRDGMPSVCCCCRPFLFCLRGIWRSRPFSHPTMEQYDQYDPAEEGHHAKGGRIRRGGGSGGVEVEQLSDLEGDDGIIDLAAHGDFHNAPKSSSVSPKVYGCWPLYWPFSANSAKFNKRHYFTKPYYLGVQSDSDAEIEDELIQLGKSDALHSDYVGAESSSDGAGGSGAGNALRRVLASLKSGSPFRLSLARGMRRAARRVFRFVACRGFVGPIGIRRLWGPAVSRYRLPSPIWSTMPLWSGLIMELTCLFLSPSMSSALEDVFGYSSSSSELGCSLVLYIAACLHFVLAAWLLSGVWKQPLRSPFLNWCTGIAWLITGLHLLMHGVVASDFITYEVDMEAAAEQFAMWEQKVLPSLLADEIVDAVSRNSSSAFRGLLSTASLAVPSAGYISKDSVTTEMVTCLAGTVVGGILSGKGAPVYRTAAGALIPMRPPPYYCVQQAVVDKAASMVDDTLRLYLREVTRDVSNSSAVLNQLARNNAPLYVDNCGVLDCDAEGPSPTGMLPSAGDVSLGDLLTTPRGHIWLNTFFLLLFTAVTGVRIASAFFFLISDTFLVVTASGAIKRKRGAQRLSQQQQQQHQKLDNNESRARAHTHDNQYSINSMLPSRQPTTSSCGAATEGLPPTDLDYYFYFYKDESLLLPCPNDDVSARAMDNEEVFAEMGWAVASGVEKACVAMYDVFRERFGLTSLDEVDDDEGRLEKLAARLNTEREKDLSSRQGHSSPSIDPHRLVRYRVAKVKGLLPPPAQWEVFSSAGPSLLAKCLSKICGCCDDRVGSLRSAGGRSNSSSGRAITSSTSRARAKSVAYANLLSSGLDESGGTFDFDELLMINKKEGDGSSEDDRGERLDSGFRAEAFSQQRKRAASRMYIAMAAAGEDGTISGGGRVRERSRRVTITTRIGELDEPLTRKRGTAVILSKGGVLEASPVRSRQRADEGTTSRKESSEGTDELDEAILRFIVKHDAELKKEEEDDEMNAACVAIDGGVGMMQGLASPLPPPRTRRFTMFSPRDESNAKSVSTYQRVRRKQSMFVSADVEELDVDVHDLDVEELEAVAAAEAKRLGSVKVTQTKQHQQQGGHESHQSASPRAAQQPSTQQVPYVPPPKPKRGSRVRVESASPNSEEHEVRHNDEHMKRGEEASAPSPPLPVARRRVGGVRTGRSMLSETTESDVNFVGNHTSSLTAGFGETMGTQQQQAPQRPKSKAKIRTKSEFVREVESDDTI